MTKSQTITAHEYDQTGNTQNYISIEMTTDNQVIISTKDDTIFLTEEEAVEFISGFIDAANFVKGFKK
jgi:hypothetical protein